MATAGDPLLLATGLLLVLACVLIIWWPGKQDGGG